MLPSYAITIIRDLRSNKILKTDFILLKFIVGIRPGGLPEIYSKLGINFT